MRPRRLVLAVLTTALIWAPSSVSAAGNELTVVSISSEAGPTATTVTLTVAYAGKFPALGVAAHAGGSILPMVRVAGTATAGTWVAVVTLPEGTWPVTFTAVTERGNAPTATATLVVGEPASAPTAAPGGGGGPAPDQPTPPGGGGTASHPATAPTTPAPSAVPTAAAAPAAPSAPVGSASATPTAAADSGGGASTPAGGGSTGGGPAPSGEAGAPAEAAGDGVEPADAPVRSYAAAPVADDSTPMDAAAGSLLAVMLACVAATALVGTGMIIAGRRRADDEDEETAGDLHRGVPAPALAALERRTLRRAHIRLTPEDEDPIIAALRVGTDPPPVRPRRRDTPRQVSEGSGTRDLP
jgi:hypothetical protein